MQLLEVFGKFIETHFLESIFHSCNEDLKLVIVVFVLKLKCFYFQVIEALLKKFKIADNPRKFALFECYQEQDNHGTINI